MILPPLIKKTQYAKLSQYINSLSRFAHLWGKKKFPLFIIISLLALLLAGCQDRGIVGSNMPGTGLDVSADTFQVKAIDAVHLEPTTGNQHYFSAGKFHDPLFGNLTLTGLMQPTLANKDSSHSFGSDTRIMLKLYIHHQGVYGDSLDAERFKLIAIDQKWRAKQWNIHEKVDLGSNSTVATFSVKNQDSVMVPLSQSFVKKYKSFFQRTDSSRNLDYLNQLHGFAVVPQNAKKIVAFTPDSSSLVITNIKVHTDSTDHLDTLRNIGLRYWAYTLNRSDTTNNVPKTTEIFNTLESIAHFHFAISTDQVDPNNISKIELLIHRPQQQLQASIGQAGSHAVRPPNDTLKLYYKGRDDLLENIYPGPGIHSSYINGIYSQADSAYHFSITGNNISWIFDSDSSRSFYIVPNFTDGTIRSSLLFNSRSPSHTSPKIIITHTHNK
jgi:hypothetical protein